MLSKSNCTNTTLQWSISVLFHDLFWLTKLSFINSCDKSLESLTHFKKNRFLIIKLITAATYLISNQSDSETIYLENNFDLIFIQLCAVCNPNYRLINRWAQKFSYRLDGSRVNARDEERFLRFALYWFQFVDLTACCYCEHVITWRRFHLL